LGAFALLFAVAPRLAGGEEADLEWLIAQAGGVLVPFAFVLYFASSTRLGLHFHSYGILLVPLSAAAGWIARAQRTYRIGLGGARGSPHPARDLPAAGVPAPGGGPRDGRRARGGRERPRPAARLSAAVGVLRRPARRGARLPAGRPGAARARGPPHGRVRGRRAGRAAAPRASARAGRAAPAALAVSRHDA